MLGQVKVKDKSNEISALPALLNLLDLTGNIVTLDAMGTQTKIADLIIHQGGDYVLSRERIRVRCRASHGQAQTRPANHPKLLDSVKECFRHHLQSSLTSEVKPTKSQCSHESKIEAAHYRLELRSCWVLPIDRIGLYKQEQWSGLKTVVMVNRKRHLWNKVQTETQFYLSSLPQIRKSYQPRNSPALGNRKSTTLGS